MYNFSDHVEDYDRVSEILLVSHTDREKCFVEIWVEKNDLWFAEVFEDIVTGRDGIRFIMGEQEVNFEINYFLSQLKKAVNKLHADFNYFFFEYLQRADHSMIAEIPSDRDNFRRWVYIHAGRKCSESSGFVFSDHRFAYGPVYWCMDVFDFDHATYDFKDYEKDEDCGVTQREYVERVETTDLDVFKIKLKKYSLNQDMFAYSNPDFPQ